MKPFLAALAAPIGVPTTRPAALAVPLATLGAPTMEEEKKAAKDYDGDGKVESGKDEYFGSKDKAIKKAMGKKVKEEVEEVDEAMSSYDRARKAAARRAADRNAARRRGELGGRMERETYTSEGGKRMHYKGYTARDGE